MAYCDENVLWKALVRSSVYLFLQMFGVLVYYVSGFCSQVVWGLLRFPFKLGDLNKQGRWEAVRASACCVSWSLLSVQLEAVGSTITALLCRSVARHSRGPQTFQNRTLSDRLPSWILSITMKYLSDWTLASQFIKHSGIIESQGRLLLELAVFLILESLCCVIY